MASSHFEAVLVVGPRHRTLVSHTFARRVAVRVGCRHGLAAARVARVLGEVGPGAEVTLSRRQERLFHTAVVEVAGRA